MKSSVRPVERRAAGERLEDAHRRRADGEHAVGGLDAGPGFGAHLVAFAVQRVILDAVDRERPEGVEADVERHALDVELREQLGREVQPRGRRGGRAGRSRIDRLVAVGVGERLGDVRR